MHLAILGRLTIHQPESEFVDRVSLQRTLRSCWTGYSNNRPQIGSLTPKTQVARRLRDFDPMMQLIHGGVELVELVGSC